MATQRGPSSDHWVLVLPLQLLCFLSQLISPSPPSPWAQSSGRKGAGGRKLRERLLNAIVGEHVRENVQAVRLRLGNGEVWQHRVVKQVATLLPVAVVWPEKRRALSAAISALASKERCQLMDLIFAKHILGEEVRGIDAAADVPHGNLPLH